MTRLLIERDVECPMRDGVILRADVYRPDGPGPFPVLLQRTPYGKGFSSLDQAVIFASRGYAVVIQDTRGRWASEGVHYPMRDEFEDGYDAVEWAGAQSWSNGKVGMFGGSYVGFTQWAAAIMRPPSLKAIFAAVTFGDTYEHLIYPGGAFAVGVAMSWSLGAGIPVALERTGVPETEKTEWIAKMIAALDSMAPGDAFRYLPLEKHPLLSHEGLYPFFPDCVLHPLRDDHWRSMSITDRYGQIQVPAYHLGGWYDIFTQGTLHNYTEVRRSGGSERARRGQKLIMGPWLHGPLNGLVGEVDFGFRASAIMVDIVGLHLRWFDYWLKGEQNGIMDEPPVRLFVMGRNEWRDEDAWPLSRAVDTPYYLHSSGRANTLHGDGTLGPASPGVEAVDTYVYDPRNPVPTRGGGLCCWQAALPGGAFDQREIEARPDVLVYTSPPLDADTEVTGPLSVHLWAATSAPDTCFAAKLVDVGPCGYARNVADGIIRAACRDNTTELVPVPRGEPLEYVIDLAATSNAFLAGHRIRVEISSSNYPRFTRHPNALELASSEADLRPAIQAIYHDSEHPSHIVLPVVPA